MFSLHREAMHPEKFFSDTPTKSIELSGVEQSPIHTACKSPDVDYMRDMKSFLL
jgi:hypothetical protein